MQTPNGHMFSSKIEKQIPSVVYLPEYDRLYISQAGQYINSWLKYQGGVFPLPVEVTCNLSNINDSLDNSHKAQCMH